MSDGDIDRVMQILCKRRKNSPCLLGRPGIRVASVVEGLAKRIANGSTPMIFQGKKVSDIQAHLKYNLHLDDNDLRVFPKELYSSLLCKTIKVVCSAEYDCAVSC